MFESLREVLPADILYFQEPMKNHTTFRVGGNAAVLAEPESIQQVEDCVVHCIEKKYPYLVIGAGSNLLVSDDGYEGVVIKIAGKIKKCSINGNQIYAEAGISLAELSRMAAKAALTGLEFAEGIPGKLGGGLFMNAGAYGGELNDLVCRVDALNLETGEKVEVRNVRGETFGYRTSYFQKHPYIILGALLELQPGEPEAINARMKELSQKRKSSQPLNYPSAGSTFKRPHEPGKYAGALIDQAGLKGYRCGGAQVSEKHAGFIINYERATAADIFHLIQDVQKKVYEFSGIHLEPEVRMIGKF